MMTAPVPLSGVSLAYLLAGLVEPLAISDVPVLGLATDSRRVQPGDVFFAVAGLQQHGMEHVSAAVQAGAAAVVWEPLTERADFAECAAQLPVPQCALPQLGQWLGVIADRFYAAPSEDLFVVGVTGTDGKTSCTHFIAEALSAEKHAGGLLGTLGYGVYGQLQPASHTTPDALQVQCELAELRAVGVRHVAMEVSSHGLHQGRVNGVRFRVAVFTNLSRDHLDYHVDLDAYGAAKSRLFQMPGLQAAVINGGDAFGRTLLASLPAGVRAIAYGMEEELVGIDPTEQVVGSALQRDAQGMSLRVRTPWGEGVLHTGLLGGFNASNLLAALTVLLLADVPLADALARLSQVHTVAGRMERFPGSASQPLVVVDYAHTPRALEQVLGALRGHCRGALWCVFGAGGDRDAGKRPLMGAVAEALADHAIVTDDNPRGEEPASIRQQILAGMQQPGRAREIADRGAAIAAALRAAQPNDVVLVAGKGHEDYQLVGAERHYFSDRDQVRAWLAGETAW